MSLDNFKKVNDLLEASGLDIAAQDGFWNFLGDSDVTWGSDGTITLIKCSYIHDLILDFINSDPEDEDNVIYIGSVNNFFKNYDQEYLIID